MFACNMTLLNLALLFTTVQNLLGNVHLINRLACAHFQ